MHHYLFNQLGGHGFASIPSPVHLTEGGNPFGLNKGEALHSLARQLFFDRLGELRDRTLENQIHRASCLHLLMAAIAAWNTVYLTEAIAILRKRSEDIPEATLAHIAPLGWEHIRLIGDYHFAEQSGRSLDNLHPLRLQEGEESV